MTTPPTLESRSSAPMALNLLMALFALLLVMLVVVVVGACGADLGHSAWLTLHRGANRLHGEVMVVQDLRLQLLNHVVGLLLGAFGFEDPLFQLLLLFLGLGINSPGFP